MMPQLFAIALGSHIALSQPVNIPHLDVEPSCRLAESGSLGIVQSRAACLKDEVDARGQLERHWTEYQSGDRATCVGSVASFEPTYTELLTCLEMSEALRALRRQNATNVK